MKTSTMLKTLIAVMLLSIVAFFVYLKMGSSKITTDGECMAALKDLVLLCKGDAAQATPEQIEDHIRQTMGADLICGDPQLSEIYSHTQCAASERAREIRTRLDDYWLTTRRR